MNNLILPFLMSIVLSAVSSALAAPANWHRVGDFTTNGTWQIAKDKASLNGELSPQRMVELNLRLALNKPTTLSLQSKDEKPVTLILEAQDGSLANKGTTVPLPDALIAITLRDSDNTLLFKNDYYVRPNPVTYKGDERADLLARWNTSQPASEHALRLKIITIANSAGIWIDDRFVGESSLEFPATVNLDLAAGNALGAVESKPLTVDRNRYVPIDLEGYQGSTWDATAFPLKRDTIQAVNKMPFAVAAAGDVVDVGTSRWLEAKVGAGGLLDQHFARSPFNRNPGNILMSVPTDDYSFAHLLVAVDPDPAKNPVLTLSVTRYLHDAGDTGGRGDGVAYSSIELTRKNGKWPRHVRQLGTVRMKNAAGKERKMPLLQVAIPIHSGEIPDVIDETGIVYKRSAQHLDLELTKEIQVVRNANHSSMSYKPVGKPSAVLVYGLTLERAPVKVRTTARQTGNIFYSTEKIGFDLALQNRTSRGFSGMLLWKLTDFYWKSVTGQRKVNVPVQAAPSKLGIDLSHLDLGWYKAELSLTDATGNSIWQQPTSLAVLAPDTRRAGSESPFGTWWFQHIHGGTKSLDEIGPLFQRMGFRHVSPFRITPTGEELARYGLSVSMIPYIRSGSAEQAFPRLDEWFEKHPNVKRAMVFHESGQGAGFMFPQEFLGKDKPELSGKTQEAYDKQVPRGIEYARYIREKYPDVKLIVGNSLFPFIAGLMQNGYPKELVDAWGDEEAGQSIIPEAPPNGTQGSLFWMQQYDKMYGYNKPVTTAFEWRYRGTSPGYLSELEQAQYYTRDVLKALAFGADSINPGLIYDVGYAYYYSRWGSVAFLRRYPLLNPKISYVAMAVLTQQLDGAKFQRVLDTKSPTLNVMEFRQGEKWVYALWIPRGEESVTLDFANGNAAQLTDMNGQSRQLSLQNQSATITVGGSPVYVHSPSQITNISSGETSVATPKSTFVMADPLNSLDEWNVVDADDAALEQAHFDFPRQRGKVDAKVVSDSEKKAALELTLQPQPQVPWPVERYVTLEPRQPVPLRGKPASVGLWVKGNSSWSKIYFEVEDANGEKFYSIGAVDGGEETNGWSLGDWKGTTYVDFDGWNFISAKLPRQYDDIVAEPQVADWRSDGDGNVEYPVRVTKIVVGMRDKVVQVNRAVNVPNRSIRLYGLGGE